MSNQRYSGSVWLLIRVAAVFGCVASAACDTQPYHPSDATLIRRFETHEPDFRRLAAMSDEDPRVIRIPDDFTRLDSNWAWPRPDSLLGFSHARWDEYRTLFDRLGLESGLSRETEPGGAPVVILTASSRGIVGHGSSKGYAYSRAVLRPVYRSLDPPLADVRGDQRHGVAFRALRDGWYLETDW